MQIYINRDGQQSGPYPFEDVLGHLASGALLPTDWAFTEGMTDWAPLGDVVASLQAPAPAPAPQPAPVAPQPAAAQPAAAQPMAAQPAAAQPAAAQPAAAQPAAAQPMAAQPMAAQPMAAQPMAAQPMAAQPLADPSKLSAGGGAAVAAQPKEEKKAKAKPKKTGGGALSGVKKLMAGKGKVIILGGLGVVGLGVGLTLFLGGEKAEDVEFVPPTQQTVTSEGELRKIGAVIDMDAGGSVTSITHKGYQYTGKELGWVLEQKALTKLTLIQCGIDDVALAQLKGLQLTLLNLSGNPKVTDKAAETLSEIKTLTTLIATETGMTDASVQKLKETLPACIVTIKLPEGGGPGANPGGGNPSTGF